MERGLGDAQHRALADLARGIRPGSPKQAITAASTGPASRICSATPAAAMASSKKPSIEAGPKPGWVATISTSAGAAAGRPARCRPSSSRWCWG
jgi:hypothetical protein